MPLVATPSARRPMLLVAPLALLATTLLAFHGFVAAFGFPAGYLMGFLFKWTFWCLLVPFWIVGRDRVVEMFRGTRPRVGRPAWLGWALLALSLVVAYGYAFPRVLPLATAGLVALSAVIAVVNGTLEEVFWRGTFVSVFRGRFALAVVVPAIGFGGGRAARDRQLALGSPVLAVLHTAADAVDDWLSAGQALARVLLRATVDGVSASFLNQPIETATLRPRLREALRLEREPQILLRMGYGPDVRPTPRRPLEEVLVEA